jgi:hypothetical protein
MTEASNIRPNETSGLIMTADFVKENFLFGVDLRDDDGNEMPDSLIEFYIKSATRWIERELDIYLTPVTITNEQHDYHFQEYINFSFLKVFHKPLLSVARVAIQFPLSTSVLEFDPSWIRAESVSGQINLVPTGGTISSFLISGGGSFLPMLYTNRDYVPHIISVDYVSGFRTGEIPFDILEVVGKKAALGPLNIAGDLIAGAGIASKSLSIDGLSQSIGTTSSATNAGYGARMINYGKEIEQSMKYLRGEYRGIGMVVA